MQPSQFLAHIRQADAVSGPRAYRASITETRPPFLTLHQPGTFDALPYSHLELISGEETATRIRLTFRIPLIIRGRNLLPVFETIREQRCAHLYVFDAARHDEPEPDAPVITSIAIEMAKGTA